MSGRAAYLNPSITPIARLHVEGLLLVYSGQRSVQCDAQLRKQLHSASWQGRVNHTFALATLLSPRAGLIRYMVGERAQLAAASSPLKTAFIYAPEPTLRGSVLTAFSHAPFRQLPGALPHSRFHLLYTNDSDPIHGIPSYFHCH
jgi:hypothetical protein